MADRFIFIDLLKGIAILLIVYGHIIPGSIPGLTEYVSTFHIPLFFFISGLLFDGAKYSNRFKLLCKNRWKGLVLPFIYFSIIVAFGYYFITDAYLPFITNLLFKGWGGYALWFIPVLILVELCYFPISRLNRKYIFIIVALCCLISYYSAIHIGYIPHNALLTLCGVWFYGIGNLCRPLLKYITEIKRWQIIAITIGGFGLSLLYIPVCNTLPEWFINKIPSPVFYLTALFATMGMIGTSLILSNWGVKYINTLLTICGKQSLIILAFHQIICMVAGLYLPSKATILLMIVLLAFLVWFIPTHMPWMVGKSRQS